MLTLISYIQAIIQISYAAQQVRTLRIIVQLDKIAVPQGDAQTIRFQVVDEKTSVPIGGAITSSTVNYPDGTTVRQFSAPTDSSGHASVTWKIEADAPLGPYSIHNSAFETGYLSTNFENSFNVVTHQHWGCRC